MAVTKIWSIKGWHGRAVIYIENPDKTQMAFENDEVQSLEDVMIKAMQDDNARGLGHTIEYAADGKKTEMRQFVTALNCVVKSARDEMMAVKEQYHKYGGNTAYHMYQAFEPGEVDPTSAHEIGVKLAQELFGDKYQTIIATHLDKDHIHNHIVINSVSFKDGQKFDSTMPFWGKIRRTSDRLCREYGLSVIDNSAKRKRKSYTEFKAEKEGKYTWRGFIKLEVDEVIRMSMTEAEFLRNLKERGYEIKIGAHFAVRPPGKPKFFRLDSNFGEEYSLAGINKRINSQGAPIFPEHTKKQERTVRHITFKGNIHTTKKVTGFRALYIHYMYLLGKLPRGRPPIHPNQIFFLYREDLRKLDRYAKEIQLLARNRIDTAEQLCSYKTSLLEQMEPLKEERSKLYNKLRREKNEPKRLEIKAQIKIISQRMGVLRKEVLLCDDIATHTKEMKEKITAERQFNKKNREEKSDHTKQKQSQESLVVKRRR